MAGVVVAGRFPKRRLTRAALNNATRLLFRGALRNWLRNLATTAPALGSMTLLLLLSGLVGVLGFALWSVAQTQTRDAAVLHVYLRDGATTAQVDALRSQLSRDPLVASEQYVSKAQALQLAQKRPGLPDLARASGSNPFPASFDVQVKRLQDVGKVDASVRHAAAVDPVYPTSYDPGAYQRLMTMLLWVAIVGAAFMLLLGFVAITVTANSIRAAIHSRRDEVTIMQLVGAPRWMVRGPFVIEGAITGGAAGLLAGLATLIVTVLAVSAGASSFVQVAPGLSIVAAALACAAVFLAGLVLGSGSSVLGVHRHLES
jgi:cell division transport system permease protein